MRVCAALTARARKFHLTAAWIVGLIFVPSAPNVLKSQIARDATGQTKEKEQDSQIHLAAEHLSFLVECPERLWPGLGWENSEIVFEDPEMADAVVWNDQWPKDRVASSRISSAPSTNFVTLPPGGFKYWDAGGKRAMLVVRGPNDDWQRLILKAVHELFHETGESLMPPPSETRRGYFYPEDWRPRYFRTELILWLRSAVRKPRAEALEAAAYWRNRLQEMYPDDVARTKAIDIREGTANFVGLLGASLAEAGCSASDEALIRNLQNRLSHSGPPFEVDDESYQLGALAGLLLTQRQAHNWRERAAGGSDLTEMLLDGVNPSEQKADQEIEAWVLGFYKKKNNELRPIVEAYKSKVESSEYRLLAIPMAWLVGSFSPHGFVNFSLAPELPKSRTVLGLHGRFQKPNGPAAVSLSGIDGSIVDLGEPMNYFLFPVRKGDLNLGPAGSLVETSPTHVSIDTGLVTATDLVLSPRALKGLGEVLIAQ
jgi:hypothetical protein